MRNAVFQVMAFSLWASAATLAEADIYSFTDGDGTVHLSNVPVDDRYAVLIAASDGSTEAVSPVAAGMRAPNAASGNRYGPMIEDAARRYRLDAALLHAVIAVESHYDPDAVSRKGATGLMQLMPETAKRYGVGNVRDPGQNIRGGAHYLKDLLDVFHQDLRLALAAYNAGEDAVHRNGERVPAYRETAAYVPKVMELYRKLRANRD
jgi:soluble lytic murein transglycosylase-like protein